METITFDDGSFIKIEKSLHRNNYVTIIMCGLNEEGNKLTMSSSDLSPDQVEQLCHALSNT